MRIAEWDKPNIVYVTGYCSYKFLVIPFGLTNSLATLCNLMNDVFYEFVDHFVVVYLDDIVIYSKSLEDHLKHLRKVLPRLSKINCMSRKRSVSLPSKRLCS